MRRHTLEWLLIIVAPSVGCAPMTATTPKSLAFASSGSTGCSPDQIRVDAVAENGNAVSWTSMCRGRPFRCSAIVTGSPVEGERLDSVSCTPDGGAAAHAQSPAPAGGASFAPGVAREPRESGPGWVLRARVAEGLFRMVLSVPLNEQAGDVSWSIVPSDSGRSDVNDSCEVVLLLDGERVQLARSRSAGDPQQIKLKVPLALVQRMAEAERVVGRVCEEEWRLTPASREILKEFFARLEEEELLSTPKSTAPPAAGGTTP